MSLPVDANVVGALALAIADRIGDAAGAQAPEPGSAAAALCLIGHEPGISIEALRRAVGLSHSAMVRAVDRLAALGLVERRPSPTDSRAVALHLTAAGRQVASRIVRARDGAIERGLATLTPRERQELGRLSAKLLTAMACDPNDAHRICRLCDFAACDPCPIEAALRAQA